MQTSIKSTSKCSTLTRCIKNQTAKLASKKPAIQVDIFGPPADLNESVIVVTTPADSGQLVGLPTCLFPQPQFFPVRDSYTGHRGASIFQMRDGFGLDDEGSLDATLNLPMGGAECFSFGHYFVGFACRVRPGSHA